MNRASISVMFNIGEGFLRRIDGEFVIEQVAEGFSAEEVRGLTEMDVKIPMGAA